MAVGHHADPFRPGAGLAEAAPGHDQPDAPVARRRELGFAPRYSIEDAVRGLAEAMAAGKLPNSLEDPRYFNIRTMQQVGLR